MPNDDVPPAPTPPFSPADDVSAWAVRMLLPYFVDPRDPDDRRRHARGAELLRLHETAYADTDNPLFAWSAWHLARTVGLAVPEWVLRYIDAAADKLWRAANPDRLKESHRAPAAIIAEALGMTKRGPGTVFSDFWAEPYEIWVAALVYFQSREHGKPYLVWESVAKQCGGSDATVRRIWDKWRYLFAQPDTA